MRRYGGYGYRSNNSVFYITIDLLIKLCACLVRICTYAFIEMWRIRKSRYMYAVMLVLLLVSVVLHAVYEGTQQLLFLVPGVIFILVMAIKHKIWMEINYHKMKKKEVNNNYNDYQMELRMKKLARYKKTI